MPSENLASQLWLRLQCQMINGVSQGVLVKAAPQTQTQNETLTAAQTIATWPTQDDPGAGMANAVREVLTKRRTYLQRDEGNTLLLGRPIELNRSLWGVVVLRLSFRDPTGITAATRLLKWGEAWLQYILYKPNSPQPLQPLNLLDKTTREATLAEAALSLVNDAAAQLKAQRVSLGLIKASKLQLQSLSHAAHFDRQSPVALSLLSAMQETLAAGRAVIVDRQQNKTEAAPAHWRLLAQNRDACVHSLLLEVGKRPVGVLLLEGCDEGFSQAITTSISPVLPMLAHSLDLKAAAEEGIAQQLFTKTQNKMRTWFGPGHLTAKVIAAVVLLFCAGLFVPAPYRVAGEAVLQGTHKHVLVANQDGYLAEVLVRPGDHVQKGDVLARLNDDDMQLERRKLHSALQQHRHSYDNALVSSQRAQAAIAQAQIDQARIQLELIDKQLERTALRSPMDGMVVSEDISQSVGAPVKQGELLFEIASEQDYRVMIYVNERDIGFISEQQPGQAVLTSLPGEVLDVRVVRITPISEIRAGQNHFRVEAELVNGPDALRPGMTGSGKISVAKRSYGWIIFHDLVHWLRLQLWW